MQIIPLTPTYSQYHELYNFAHVTHVGYDRIIQKTAITFTHDVHLNCGKTVHVKESVKTIYELLKEAAKGGAVPLHITTAN